MGEHDLRRFFLLVAASGAVLGASARAKAETPCPVELVPASAPSAWVQAALDAERRLARAPLSECASVELAVSAKGGALLTFSTKDGRRAVRGLRSPDELLPSLEALLVTLLGGVEPTVPAPAPSPPAPPLRPAPPSPPAALPAPERPGQGTRFVLGGSAGARLALAGAYMAPALVLRPGVRVGRWELGGSVEWDPAYAYLPGGAPAGFSLGSFQAGFTVGRREPVGSIELGYGLGLAVASVRERADPGADGKERSLDAGQPRASVYTRVAGPRAATVRPALELGADVVLGSIARQGSDKRDLPDLPRWGLLFTVGAEVLLP